MLCIIATLSLKLLTLTIHAWFKFYDVCDITILTGKRKKI